MMWDETGDSAINYMGKLYTAEDWLTKELDPCQKVLTNTYSRVGTAGIGIPASDIYGWRTPRLEWNDNLLSALSLRGFTYDCSVESDSLDNGKTNYWPFTLDNGHPFEKSITSHPGLWELPPSRFMIPENLRSKTDGDSIMTGLDYNVWVKKEWGGMELTSSDFTEILKYTLDLRMKGNRAPFLVGLHSDIYSTIKDKEQEYPASGTYLDRQKAIEDFLEYATTTYPEVRIVNSIDMIKWMKNPVGL